MKQKRKNTRHIRRKPLILLILFPLICIMINAAINTVEKLDIEWSPTGTWLVFSCGVYGHIDPFSNLYIMRQDGSDLQQITTNRYIATNPTWSPDGEWIAFASYNHIYKIRPDGTDLVTLTRISSYDRVYSLDWSPNSEWIAYVVSGQSGNQLQRVSAETGRVYRILLSEENIFDAVRWSSDAQSVVYSHAMGRSPQGIYRLSLDTRETETLYAGQAQLLDLRVNDNQLVVRIRQKPYLLDLKKKLTRINHEFFLTISPDSQTVLHHSHLGIIESSKLNDEESIALTHLEGCLVTSPRWFNFEADQITG